MHSLHSKWSRTRALQMSDRHGNTNWLSLYREAVLEQDSKKLRARVIRAQHAIRHRARELWYTGALDTTERRQMDAATHHLRLLCAMAVTK